MTGRQVPTLRKPEHDRAGGVLVGAGCIGIVWAWVDGAWPLVILLNVAVWGFVLWDIFRRPA